MLPRAELSTPSKVAKSLVISRESKAVALANSKMRSENFSLISFSFLSYPLLSKVETNAMHSTEEPHSVGLCRKKKKKKNLRSKTNIGVVK